MEFVEIDVLYRVWLLPRQAGSSTGERSDYRGEIVGSIPTPPTKTRHRWAREASHVLPARMCFGLMAQTSELEQLQTNAPREVHGPAYKGSDLLSIDVEDYFQVEAFADRISRSDWSKFELRVRQNTDRILELLSEFRQTATFFVLGWVAEREPALVRRIAEDGHEV